eukprot:CAMPEP_0116972646 /NCGR_PEP_ID=MMETSP0467-20121206/53979_1 /TAXON_ID=283647 /ORGANISM="Mesodinium pulex, Strain SPMC105" /LENGTH=36 /DNA_ID= /DNA_START= /DNA_END= /DNA_ORIENTATION=
MFQFSLPYVSSWVNTDIFWGSITPQELSVANSTGCN